MKFTIERDAALRAIQSAQGVVRKSSIPIMSNVLLTVADDRLEVLASDMTIWVRASVPCRVETAGSTSVPAAQFLEILTNLPSGAEILAHDEGDKSELAKCAPLRLKAGRFNCRLPALPADDFPLMAEVEGDTVFSIPATDLSGLISDTMFAVDKADKRPFLSGVFIHAIGGKLKAFGSDSRVIALREVALPIGAESFEDGAIFPVPTLSEVMKVIQTMGANDDIRVTKGQGRASFEMGDTIITTKLIDAEGPKYVRIIPTEWPMSMTIDTDLLLAAIKRTLVMADDAAPWVKISAKDGVASFLGRNGSLGEAMDFVDCTIEGESAEATVKGSNALAILDHIRTENVIIRMDATRVAFFEDGVTPKFYMASQPVAK